MRPHFIILGLVMLVTSTRCLAFQDIAYADYDTIKQMPLILFRTRPSALVLIDGEPRLQRNEHWGLEAVVNSPFVIVKDKDAKYYLYGGGHWYVAPNALGPYTYTHDDVSGRLNRIARGFKKAARKDGFGQQTEDMGLAPLYDIVISTTPAILIQTSGNPQPEQIPGTSLVYMNNSEDNIFFDTVTHEYYIETGDKWYRSDALKDASHWQPISGAQLPTDFARIPAESPKAEVLADVPGTPLATEIRQEQSVPEIQQIDRETTTKVQYDGKPEFSPIEGTGLQYATNTCAIVLFQNGLYYTLDDGVWFIASTPEGLWYVSNRLPSGINLIPKGHPVYRSRFVYIYQVDHDFVWDGYLPGYVDDPAGGCGLAETEDYDGLDQAWCFDLDFVFGWGGGWYEGYYRLERHHRYYGSGGLGGKWAHWQKCRGWGANKWNGGTWAGRGQWRPHAIRTQQVSRPLITQHAQDIASQRVTFPNQPSRTDVYHSSPASPAGTSSARAYTANTRSTGGSTSRFNSGGGYGGSSSSHNGGGSTTSHASASSSGSSGGGSGASVSHTSSSSSGGGSSSGSSSHH